MTGVAREASDWEGLTAERLGPRWGLPAVHLFEVVASTNDVARRLASEGAAPGTAVLAEQQVAGRGRAGRGWDSPPRLGIWISMIVPPPDGAEAAGLLPLRVGVAVARAIEPFIAPARAGVKWPNDVLVRGAKVGGVLCEGAWTGEMAGPVVVGVGLNVSHAAGDLADGLRGLATSLRMVAGSPPERLAVADSLVTGLATELVRSPLPQEVLCSEITSRDVLRGQTVIVSEPGTDRALLKGAAMGIGTDGALHVRVGEPADVDADADRIPERGPSGTGDRSGSPRRGDVRAVRAGTVRLAGVSVPTAVREGTT